MCFKTLETTHTIRELLYSCSEFDNTSNFGEGFVVVVVVVAAVAFVGGGGGRCFSNKSQNNNYMNTASAIKRKVEN